MEADNFVEVMDKHWTDELGNVSSDALRACWKQLAETFNNHIRGEAGDRWDVLPFPTGAGKTEGAIVFCALLPVDVNVLIVTKLTKDCNSIAERINHFRAKYLQDVSFDLDYAKAYHTKENETVRKDLGQYPVLVVTHKAFENAMDDEGKLKDFIEVNPFTKRDLIVIDEALDVIDTAQVTLDNLRCAVGNVKTETRKHYPDEIAFIEEVIKVLGQHEADSNNKEKKTLVFNDFPDLLSLFQSEMITDKHDLNNLELVELYQETKKGDVEAKIVKPIRDLSLLLGGWLYSHRQGKEFSLNTTRLIIPEGMKSAVILDATAQINKIYEVIDKCEVLPPADPNTRTYINLTLNVSWGHNTGKDSMTKNKKKVVKDLLSSGIVDDDTLVITHKEVATELEKRDVKHFGHYGKVNGSNQWKDLTKVVIFGLYRFPDTHAINTFNAAQGQQPQEWFDDTECRVFKSSGDIKKELEYRRLASETIQGVNRICVRRVIDEKGNCPKSEGYIMLPDDELGKAVLEHIKQAMPGININEKWIYEHQLTGGRGKEKVLKRYVETMPEGAEISMKQLNEDIGIHGSTLKRLVKKSRDIEKPLHAVFKQCGVSFKKKPEGQTKRQYLIKVTLVGGSFETVATIAG